MKRMKIVTVIPLQKGANKENLTYFSQKDIEDGAIVSVPLRSKKILGLVVSKEDVLQEKSGIKGLSFKLKKVIEVKRRSIFRNEFIESTGLFNSYFPSSKNPAVISLIPSVFRENYDKLEKYPAPKKNKAPETEYKNILPESNIRNEKLVIQASFEDRLSYYKTLIRGYFASKKSVFMILPTEYDINIFLSALSKGIENFTFTMHSRMKTKKLLENYEKIMALEHGVLVFGTPQFLSIPRTDFGAIIVEHENASAYRGIPKPNYDFRIFTEIFASKIGAKFILGDTLLSYETIERKEKRELGEIYPISFRINTAGIRIRIENPNLKNKIKKNFHIFSEETLEEIEDSLKHKKNVFIFSLRKGLATETVCRDCGETLSCDKCLAPVVLYSSKNGKNRMFVCNRCNTEKDPETKCKNCGSWNLISLGIGTDTVLEELKSKFKKLKIYKLDKESVKSAKKAEKIVEDFEKNAGSILVGTEIAFYYLKEKTDLSVIASFDSLWSIPNYKMGEKIIGLLLSMLSKTLRKMIIQTKNEKDPALLSIESENLLSFVRGELEDRKALNYPPFKRFIKISCQGDKEESGKTRKYFEEIFKDYQPEIFSSFISKNKNEYATNALLKVDPYKWSLPEILPGGEIDKNLKAIFSSLPSSCDISIDPEDLM